MSAFRMTPEHEADLDSTGARRVYVEVDERPRLNVLDYGGTGSPVVTLPGITTPAMSFDFVAQAMRADHRVLSLDIRGRGLSDAGTSWTLDDYADDLEALVRHLNVDRPVLVGHSMGARIAAHAAARPDSDYRGVIIADPPLTGPGRDVYPTPLSVFEAQLEEAYAGTTTDDVARWWPRWPRREQEMRARWLASCDLEAIRGSYHAFDEDDFLVDWARVTVPAVFMYGDESPVVTASGLQDCRAANPEATYLGVPGAGHMVFWDNYDAAIGLLEQALSIVDDSSTA